MANHFTIFSVCTFAIILLFFIRKRNRLLESSIAFVLFSINILPLSLWKGFRKIVKDPVMAASMKFIFGIFMFPLTYFLQYLFIAYLMGREAALVALVFFIISMPLYKLINR